MNRKTEREFTFKLLFMSDFYEKKELGDELLLYFDAPFPFEEKEDDDAAPEALSSLKESVKKHSERLSPFQNSASQTERPLSVPG